MISTLWYEYRFSFGQGCDERLLGYELGTVKVYIKLYNFAPIIKSCEHPNYYTGKHTGV